MNIFYIDNDPKKAAQQLADPHICKMQIESAQMCSVAHWENGSSAPYKKSHVNHPSTKWVRASIHHYRWTIRYGLEVCAEFEKRYGKRHKTQDVLEWLRDNEPRLPNVKFVDPPQCMDDIYKSNNTIQSYRTFYLEEKIKKKQLKYEKSPNSKPKWINE